MPHGDPTCAIVVLPTNMPPAEKVKDARIAESGLRDRLIATAAEGWTNRLIDLSRRNNLLFYKPTNVHPDLLNSRFGYVSISRASHEATIFTNDATRLSHGLGAEVSKTSALSIGHLRPVHALELTIYELHRADGIEERSGLFSLSLCLHPLSFQRADNSATGREDYLPATLQV